MGAHLMERFSEGEKQPETKQRNNKRKQQTINKQHHLTVVVVALIHNASTTNENFMTLECETGVFAR
jgi:Na+-transporting methylmalonyl-CoA/oxaloacetate decarboxylase gamma subunit